MSIARYKKILPFIILAGLLQIGTAIGMFFAMEEGSGFLSITQGASVSLDMVLLYILIIVSVIIGILIGGYLLCPLFIYAQKKKP